MRGMNSASVDLIYLDPPFHSNANYAAPIGSEAARIFLLPLIATVNVRKFFPVLFNLIWIFLITIVLAKIAGMGHTMNRRILNAK